MITRPHTSHTTCRLRLPPHNQLLLPPLARHYRCKRSAERAACATAAASGADDCGPVFAEVISPLLR